MNLLGTTVTYSRHRVASSRTLRGVVRVAMVSAALLSSACYHYTDIEPGRPVLDQRVELELNDAGRIALRRALGPGAKTVEGRVLNQTADAYEVAVFRLTNVRGESFTWTGEQVQVPVDGVQGLSRRDIDKGRSAVAVASAAGAFAVFVATRSLLGGGRDRPSGEPPPGESIRMLP